MATNTVFFCKECGYESAAWMGKCPGCGAWNTFVEEKINKKIVLLRNLLEDFHLPFLINQKLKN